MLDDLCLCQPLSSPIRFKEKAIKTVRAHVLLIKEEVKASDMLKSLKNTAVSEWKGEVSHTNSELLS